MNEIQYIMVTKWKGHWDNFWSPVPNAQSTLFTHSVITEASLISGPWPAKAKTLYIKLNDSNKFEKSWIGYSENFRKADYKGKPAIRFEVTELKEIGCPEQYKQYSNGWHVNKTDLFISLDSPVVHTNQNLQPVFFTEMAACNWQSFEEHCFHLLRLIGIHDIHKFPQSDNRGKADGFFKFEQLSILYDATLESDFDTQKETQVDNYINQLKGDKFKIADNTYTIKDTNKQVWIITRGTKVRSIRKEDNVKVKEIPYTNLIDVYHHRLNNEIGTEELWDLLKDLK